MHFLYRGNRPYFAGQRGSTDRVNLEIEEKELLNLVVQTDIKNLIYKAACCVT